MSFREDVFSDLQNDLCCPLLADEYFADINVIDYRKADMLSELEMALSPLSAKAGKLGVVVLVLPLVISDTFVEGSNMLPRQCRVTYRVLENPLVNFGTDGTRKSALSVCSRIGRVLKHYVLEGLAKNLVPDAQFIVPVEDEFAPVAYEVAFTCLEEVDQNVAQCDRPQMTIVGGNVLHMSCSTPDATIYYTLDGGYPHPTNPNGFTVRTYDAPFTIEGEFLIRAGAFKSGYLPSSIVAARFDRIGEEAGGGIAEEGGGVLTQS